MPRFLVKSVVLVKHLVSWLAVCVLFLLSFNVAADRLILDIETMDQQIKGQVIIDLYEKTAPKHVERIKALVAENLYDGVVFHRVIKGFMAQTGDVEFGNVAKFNSTRAGSGSSQYGNLKAEFSNIKFEEGVVGMARSRNIHSANSQFFIMTDYQASLNGAYTVIGKVVEGLDVVRNIKVGPPSKNGKVSKPDYIKRAVIQP